MSSSTISMFPLETIYISILDEFKECIGFITHNVYRFQYTIVGDIT